MRFARVVFMIAGIYGLIVMTPQYFLEAKTGQDFPPAITHPEFYSTQDYVARAALECSVARMC